MNKIKFAFSLFLFCLVSCNEPEGFKQPEDPLDAGREFIRAVMDGDFKEAELYISEDEEDFGLFRRYEDYMKKQPQNERLSLKSASIIINKVENLGDSICLINFSNSHSMKPMDLKIIREKENWKVDFSYTFSGNLPIQD